MSDFLLELRTEEVPARMQAGARADLEKLFRKEMDSAGVALGDLTVWSTPRRLALIARDLPLATAAVSEEIKGPRLGAPPQALEGFLRKTGLSEDQLTERDGVLYAVTEKPGRATAAVLAEAIPAIIRAFPWPKSMRWGAASISSESPRWVRPLSGVVALLGDDVIDCEVAGLRSNRVVYGHRFHAAAHVEFDNAASYAAQLRACHVIASHEERQDLIREQAAAVAHAAGLVLVADEGLVVENAGLTEWPVPLLGRFDESFLDVPPEVIQLTARTNQKYFICREPAGEGEEQGRLANAFVCTANIAASDGGAAIIDGNRKVLGARLSDARFFWEQDQKKTLAQHAEGLARITFHEKLGTVADKALRVAKLARWLVEEGIVKPSPLQGRGVGEGETLADQAELAARLCKADLVTEMVGEFPELQGMMGGYYARAEGLPDAVADAIRDHYKPVGQGDDVPTAPVTVAVSLADKLDTLAGFYLANERPTGSKDPFALRRAGIAICSLVIENQLRASLNESTMQSMFGVLEHTYRGEYKEKLEDIQRAMRHLVQPQDSAALMEAAFPGLKRIEAEIDAPIEQRDKDNAGIHRDIVVFLLDRLKVQQREAGVRHDLIDAVFALGGEDDLVRLLARVHALQAFIGSDDGINLLAGYKRAANILKKEGFEPTSVRVERSRDTASGISTSLDANGTGGERDIPLSYTPDPAEKDLIDALAAAGPKATAAVEQEDFAGAMAALATLRAPIDRFFDQVTVNDADKDKRSARLGLLARLRDAVHGVADFSRIEG